jgi:hypothetical protein
LQDRGYAAKAEGGSLVPSSLGRVVAAFLAAYFPMYVDYTFTSGLEQQLDDVSAGRAEWQKVRRGVLFAAGVPLGLVLGAFGASRLPAAAWQVVPCCCRGR